MTHQDSSQAQPLQFGAWPRMRAVLRWLKTLFQIVLMIGFVLAIIFHESDPPTSPSQTVHLQPGSHSVFIVNGFDAPLHIRIGEGGRELELAAGAQQELQIPPGRFQASASLPGVGLVDWLEQSLQPEFPLAVWNVGGAAPLQQDMLEYRRGALGYKRLPVQSYCGQHWITLGKPEYVLEAPPQHVHFPDKPHRLDSLRFNWLHYAVKGEDWAAAGCLKYQEVMRLPVRGSLALVAAVREKAPLLQLISALQAQQAMQPAAAMHSAQELLKNPAWAEALPLHDYYQQLRIRQSGLAQVREEYRTLAAGAPLQPKIQLLYLRLLDNVQGLALAQALQKRWPDFHDGEALLATFLQKQGENPSAMAHWQRYLQAKPPLEEIKLYAPQIIQAQWQARQFEASALLLQRLELNNMLDQHSLPLYLRIRTYSHARLTELPQTAISAKQLQIASLQGGVIPDPVFKASLPQALLMLRQNDLPAALLLLQKVPQDDVALLDDAHYMLFWGHSLLRKNDAALAVLRNSPKYEAQQMQALSDWIMGRQAGQAPPPAPAPMLAAAADLRALSPVLPQAERQALHRLAQKLEPVAGPQYWYAMQ